ncbi:kinase-like domain-containing protein [Phycomyces nitens]|nr:kinase-like domain-containing protein [Phycomyces nitens]
MSTQIQLSSEIKARSCSFLEGCYEHLGVLGRGSCGEVSLAIHIDTGKKVAIKVIEKSSLKSKEHAIQACNEQAICKALSKNLGHKNIVGYYDVHSDAANIYIIMEHINGGDLFQPINKYGRIGEHEAQRLFKQLLEAIYHLHKNGIVHRDLKHENILVDEFNNIRVCDFGFGQICDKNECLETYCGTPCYAAPELVSATPYKGFPVDMWSCGVILYIMLTGSFPFYGPSNGDLRRRIRHVRYTIPRFVSLEAADLISKILVKIPESRLTAKECLEHPWFSKNFESQNDSFSSFEDITSDEETSSEKTDSSSSNYFGEAAENNRVESSLVLPKTDGANFASRVKKMMRKIVCK